MPANVSTWHERAAQLVPESRAFIGGAYVEALSGAQFDNVNPATGRVLGRISAGDVPDIERAVAAAKAAFEKGAWSRTKPAHRKKVLSAFAQSIFAHREELALLETLDMGKPISDSLKVDIPGAARAIQWYAEAVDKLYDEVAPTGPDALA
ncbi:MAG TPA: aldehyde dehydrogenase family protein, partial [Steroidobacteraceae bacterium]|nr:aldehyde dehydrogenase family protein [Steroidobacteraceae bacterium]